MPTEIFNRHARPLVLQSLADTRVVFVSGARQVGKSTLGRGIVDGLPAAEEFSLDRRETRESALSDPEGFIAAGA
jgi:predicted AAA+ superfamily ATPase